MVRATKNRCRNMSQIGTTYVNGQEVLTAIDSCSSLTLIHHDLTVTTGNSNIINSKREANFIDKDETDDKNESNVGQIRIMRFGRKIHHNRMMTQSIQR